MLKYQTFQNTLHGFNIQSGLGRPEKATRNVSKIGREKELLGHIVSHTAIMKMINNGKEILRSP